MGIDVRIEGERGIVKRQLLLSDHLNWLLSLRPLDDTVCLRFIDPYENTVFNISQLPVLRTELAALGELLTDHNVEELKKGYLASLREYRQHLPPEAEEEWAKHVAAKEAVTRTSLESALRQLLDFVDEAIRLGRYHYLKFIGD